MCRCDELRQLYAAAAKERDELKAEKAALLELVKQNAGCEACAHEHILLPCGGEYFFDDDCAACRLEKTPCCGCGGRNWVWKGLVKHGEA